MASEKLPAIHLYPGDWLRDEISGCSLQAQGLWLRMMFIMHDSQRYGYLCTDGKPTPPESIARRCGCTLEQYMSLLTELSSVGVPSTTEEGIIFSRRMVRDAETRAQLAEKRSKAGSLGGRPPSRKSKRKAKLKQTPENEDENESSDVVVFEGVWGRYPRKLGKDGALKAFKKALKADSGAGARISKALDNYLAYIEKNNTEEQYIKHGSTWFNQWQEWEVYEPRRDVGNGASPIAGKYARLGKRDATSGAQIGTIKSTENARVPTGGEEKITLQSVL